MNNFKLHNKTVLLKRPQTEEQIAGGLVFEKKNTNEDLYEIVDVSSDRFSKGNLVYVKKYSPQQIFIDNEEFFLVSENDILLEILNKENDQAS